MKLYNPFRAHVVNDDGVYRIRKVHLLFGWQYLDSKDKFWWISLFGRKWTGFPTVEKATERLHRYRSTGRVEGGK